jgi:hypothetical protein
MLVGAHVIDRHELVTSLSERACSPEHHKICSSLKITDIASAALTMRER